MRADPIFPNVTGARLQTVEKKDYSWFFTFTDSVSVTTESPWRLMTSDGIVVTSEDHGQQFGLPSPVDASARVLSILYNGPIRTSRIDTSTGDLFLSFSEGTLLQFLQMSCGYEAWRLCVGDDNFICTGGGEIALFNAKPQKS
jgi:hypothetical protein